MVLNRGDFAVSGGNSGCHKGGWGRGVGVGVTAQASSG